MKEKKNLIEERKKQLEFKLQNEPKTNILENKNLEILNLINNKMKPENELHQSIQNNQHELSSLYTSEQIVNSSS